MKYSLNMLNLFININAIFIIVVVVSAMSLDKKIGKEVKYFFLGATMSIIQCVSDIWYILATGSGLHIINEYISSLIFYMTGFISIIFCSIYIFHILKIPTQARKLIIKIYQISLILWVSLCLITSITGDFFSISSTGEFVRGEFWSIMLVFPSVYMFANSLVALLFKGTDSRQRITLAVISAIPSLFMIISYLVPGITSSSMAISAMVLLIYTNTYVERNKAYYKNEAELQDSKMEVMLSQIQPHFLYNSISSAVSLCRIDPEKAAETMQNFGKYLRGNLDSLKIKTPIPFTDELKHIKAYVQLEQTRFGDMLDVEYNINVKNFSVPPLSVQPLVENAIKHGIAEKGKKGTVILTTWESDTNIYIKVSDNGQGFDTSLLADEETVHIGVTSVKNRLKKMVDGTLTIESAVGQGTTSLIRIPK